MEIKTILNSLTAAQRKQEKELREEVYKELSNYQASRRELGRLLIELHDHVIGNKKFKEYLECLGIARRSAYRWITAYKLQASLPESIVRAAGKRKLDLGSEKFQGIIKEIPLPENPTEDNAGEWLDMVVARQKESSGNPPNSPDPGALTPEERNRLTSRTFVTHCRQMHSFTATYWAEVPSKKQLIEVTQSLMGAVAAKLGITKPFTVVPDPHPGKSGRLVERLKARIPRKLEFEMPVLA